MRGLAGYGDDDSGPDSDSGINGSGVDKGKRKENDGPLNERAASDSESRLPKSQIVIKKHAGHKPKPRVHSEVEDGANERGLEAMSFSDPIAGPSTLQGHAQKDNDDDDELTRIRALLRPAPIPGAKDFGIPPPPAAPPDPKVEKKLAQFHTLKREQGKHFNDSLMSNKSFLNPHLYAQLVQFVNVGDEKVSNFPKGDVNSEWYAESIAKAQKARDEQNSASQAPGKRTQIDFASSSSSNAKEAKRYNPYGSSAVRAGQHHGAGAGGLGIGRGGAGVLGGGRRGGFGAPSGPRNRGRF